MSTNRELIFRYQKEDIPNAIITFALEECGGLSYTELFQNLDQEVIDEQRVIDVLTRYQNGEMIEYLLNKSYFLSKTFYVDKNVLIPRQETEQLVLRTMALIKEEFSNKPIIIADICTGSGVIGISLAEAFTQSQIYLTDISKECLDVASRNSKEHGLKNTKYLRGDMIKPLIDHSLHVDVIVCNPPYISNVETIDKKTWEQEPHLALLAKPNTYFYEQLLKDYLKVVNDKYLLCFEIGEDMEEALTKLVNKYCEGCSFFFEKDIYDKTRFLFIKGKK